jgi:cyclin H
MADYEASSQLNLWMFQSPCQLDLLRARANLKAREHLSKEHQKQQQPHQQQQLQSETSAFVTNLPVECFAAGYHRRVLKGEDERESSSSYYEGQGPWQNDKGNPYLTPAEEATLVSFYASKLPSLIGPKASVPRLRRESKVTATAALILRRFFLSNSVMLHDPKVIMVAAAFLGCKVEDATADVRYLEEGTSLMNAPVTLQEIIPAELHLLAGAHFDLLCFHPYKAVLALTEDLRTYLKSDKGKILVKAERPLSGQDLKPMYEAARALIDDCVVSDIPLLYSPGQIALAALMVARDDLDTENSKNNRRNSNVTTVPISSSTTTKAFVPRIDLVGYVQQRFEQDDNNDNALEYLEVLKDLCAMLQGLKLGKYGFSVGQQPQEQQDDHHSVDVLQVLKGIHKKLKKVRAWGIKDQKKKRDDSNKEPSEGEPLAKRVKTE